MKCPKCGGEMEHGFLAVHAESVYTIDWYDKKLEMAFTPTPIKREPIITPSLWWMTEIEGFRCSADHLVVLDYDKVYYPVSGKTKEEK